MVDFFQFIVAGLSQGAIYALVALGFSLIYRATTIINFAQGEFVMIGGLGTASGIAWGLPFSLALVMSLAAAAFGALLLHQILVRLAKSASITLIIIVTIGASIALRGAAQIAWGGNFHSLPSIAGVEPLRLGGVAIMPQTILILGGALVMVAALDQMLRRTRFGKAMVAAAINPRAATLVGIDLARVNAAAFLIAALLGAIAGFLVTPLSMVQFESGLMFGLKGFAAAVLGGLGGLYSVVAGGLVLGVAEALGAGYVSSAYKDALAFVLIIAILLTCPAGLFGRLRSERV
ncbi:branched-chain amino acid ABC transporter permease [Bradyrhizobium sp. NP1]|uniref:branched-chain amino acid ABC transporter permease n=1 Tax=Bradyrhizobium sp. NP1 TaxID=3049772 RepID=UPI0025A667B9|nr:branched-chain amino acid ABC transporter permease [Bradyrhizobium sp. NP1]WJR81744.1 branched-chain amino acid ABC transporter permease [Bradyrhizobium sp. NP1]